MIGLGALSYTLAEYSYHRWVAHGLLNGFVDGHHDRPGTNFAAPWCLTPLTAWALFRLAALVGLDAAAVMVGVSGTHVYQEGQHWVQHHVRTRHCLRPHHLLHHALAGRVDPRTGEPLTCNYGLTTRLWDWLFGTLRWRV